MLQSCWLPPAVARKTMTWWLKQCLLHWMVFIVLMTYGELEFRKISDHRDIVSCWNMPFTLNVHKWNIYDSHQLPQRAPSYRIFVSPLEFYCYALVSSLAGIATKSELQHFSSPNSLQVINNWYIGHDYVSILYKLQVLLWYLAMSSKSENINSTSGC